MTVITVGGDDGIVVVQHRDRADGDRLLSVVKMAKTLDLRLGERLLGLFLETPDEHHLPQQRDFLLGLQIGKSGGAVGLGFFVGFGGGHIDRKLCPCE